MSCPCSASSVPNIPRPGAWLPSNPHRLWDWINKKVESLEPKPTQRLLQSVKDFKIHVQNDPTLYMLFTEMLDEVPAKYVKDPSGKRPEVRDLDTLFTFFDEILRQPPSWDPSPQIGTPVNAVLDWPMGTKAGFAAFLRDDVNAHFKSMLQSWGDFLSTEYSCSTLTTDTGGWFSVEALESDHMKDFAKTFRCDPKLKHWGFKSWDAFFTRDFNEIDSIRAVAEAGNTGVIVSAAESTPFAVQTGVQAHDKFWIKGQPYSLKHMLDHDSRAGLLTGGTVYQAFLSADSYHKWHTPVSGTILDYRMIDGTYYSEPLSTGFSPDLGDPDPDPGADSASQGYISSVAARAVIWIQADGPAGLICLVFIGMAEVSSIEVTMPVGKHFEKGEELGKFHFGGSSFCMILRPELDVQFSLPDDWKDRPKNMKQVKVRSKLATVKFVIST
ncbi:phosphatidylserine decarboxylase family protein [Talaromyces stipitatus ATCC 10500]|uniref:Phosphatidylserine decarboxylase family protein n=1 Tax=Talaromyces stipitatus (strain ATCC 10500 / CBS 375.48 / QM 6759 / NRRL 1006) TaxID=441959 RepID=B8M1S5_TALSN|nr:phosphatidylserine decarboxylase family protein [Talaromyces stipitatus ATCC 10500]EED22162.1 phosphatidylserine decarboxylase family protein [Talaromyces stipitatus ATCC 10500]